MPNPNNPNDRGPYNDPTAKWNRNADPTTYGDADGGAWRGVSWILDPLGIGGMGGAGGTNVWGAISGTKQGWQDMQAPQIYGGGAGAAPGMPGSAASVMAGGPGAGTMGAQDLLLQQLQDQAAGRGPSLAQMQLQQGSDRAMKQAMALGQSQRGAGAGAAYKSILGQQAQIGQGMAGDSAMVRLQEQMAARGAVGGILDKRAQLEQANEQFNAGQTNQTNQFNLTTQQQALQRQQEAAIAQAKLEMEMERLRAEQAKQNSPAGMIGGIMSAFSDARLKTDVAPAGTRLYEFLDKLDSHEYSYKNPQHGDHRISPMAQELEASDAGREFVFETPDGKAVDYGKGFGTMLASQVELHKRLKKLEER